MNEYLIAIGQRTRIQLHTLLTADIWHNVDVMIVLAKCKMHVFTVSHAHTIKTNYSLV